MSTPELAVVEHALALVERTQPRFTSLMRAAKWHPIPFFGPLTSARILTFGLNPSDGEFSEARSWPARMSSEALTDRLVGYFNGNGPHHHPWFRAWSDCLSMLGASYRHDSAHIDLSPRPTATVRHFAREPQKSLFIEMLKVDAPIWVRTVEAASKVKLILLAGSATGRYYINEFVQSELTNHGVALQPRWSRGTGEGQTAFQDLVLPGGRKIPVFFCSSGPAKSVVLANAVATNAKRLTQILAGS